MSLNSFLIPEDNVASKKKNTVKNKRSRKASLPSKANQILARILVLVVLLGGVWEFLQSLNKETPKLKASMVLKIDQQTKGVGPFVPWGAVALGDDKIAVADNQNNRILLFDRKGDFIRGWGKPGQKADQFHEPSGMTTDGKGHIYVMDAWNSAIKGFDEKGKMIADIDLSKAGFFGPRGLAFDGVNFVVADTGSHRVVLVSPKGDIVATWGSKGTDDNQMQGPLAVAVDQKDQYYVADTDNDRIQWLDGHGKEIRFSKLSGQAQAVAVDHEGRVYAGVRSDDGQVRVYDPQGRLLGSIIDQSGTPEPFKNNKFLSVTPDDLLLITSGDAVYLYQLPGFGQK